MFLRNLTDYIKLRKVINKILKEENLLENLSSLFSTDNYKVNFKQDWIGRIYGVVNPAIQDPEGRIFEYNTDGTSINSFINKWIMDHMIAADRFIKNHQLFDILLYDIKQIDNNYNFLIILTPISWPDFRKSLKTAGIFLGIATTILLIALILSMCL